MESFLKSPFCCICGDEVAWLLAPKIEDEYICTGCNAKLDMDPDRRFCLTMQGLQEYLAFYEENLTLRSAFVISEKLDFSFFDTKLIFDLEHRLFCLSGAPDKTVFEGAALKYFCISEDNELLLEGSAKGLIRHSSTMPDCVIAMGPQLQMMAAALRMANHANYIRPHDSLPNYHPQMDLPEPFSQFRIELQLNHPYWSSFRCDMSAPTFNNNFPNVADYLSEYRRDIGVMEHLAALLMQVAFPNAGVLSSLSSAAQR